MEGRRIRREEDSNGANQQLSIPSGSVLTLLDPVGGDQVNHEVSPTDSTHAGTIPYLWQFIFVKPILFVSMVE